MNISPNFIETYKGYSVETNEETLMMLRQKEIYNKAMKYGYRTKDIGKIAAHVSFDQMEFQRQLSKRILIGINKSNGEDLTPYLDVLFEFLSINDSLKEVRMEWLYGIADIKIEFVQGKAKLGIALMDNINEEIYDYKSTLFKN
jgi:hypothetical protein